jgi:hypothetical protein
MITQIENAVAAFLTARFAAADPVITAEVRVATNKSEPPVGQSMVIVKCTGPDTTSRLQLAKVEAVTAQVPGHQSGGFVAEGWKDGREDTAWQPVFSLLLGVVPTA